MRNIDSKHELCYTTFVLFCRQSTRAQPGVVEQLSQARSPDPRFSLQQWDPINLFPGFLTRVWHLLPISTYVIQAHNSHLPTLWYRLTTSLDNIYEEDGKMQTEHSRFEPLNVLSLRDHIGQQITSAVLSGAFRPGERLVETAIAEQLNVSRAPVREALAALEQEGIVSHVPRRGYFVVDFSEKDIEEVYTLRLLLEGEALRRAIERASQENLAELQGLVDDLGEAALDKSDPEIIVAFDMSFHESICRLADHSRLYSAWNSLRLQTQLLIGLTSRTHYDHPSQPRVWHQRILNAMRDKDLRRAEETLEEHLLDAQQRAMSALERMHSSDGE